MRTLQMLFIVGMTITMAKAIADTQSAARLNALAAVSAESDQLGYEMDATESEIYLNSKNLGNSPLYTHGAHCLDGRTL